MLKIASGINNNFRIQAPASNPIVKNKAISFGGNYELKSIGEDTFVSTAVPAAKSFVDSLDDKEKKLLAQNIARAGYSAFNDKNYKLCIANLSKSLEIYPQNARAYHAKASAEREEGMYEEAIEDYKKALELSPDSINSLNLLALTKTKYAKELESTDRPAAAMLRQEALEDYDSAINVLETSQAQDKTRKIADIHSKKADLLMNMREYEKAMQELDSVIDLSTSELDYEPSISGIKKLETKIGSAHHKKGICLRKLAQSPYSSLNEKARDEFSEAIKYVPTSANSYYERAKINMRNSSEDAIDDIKKAIDLAPERPAYWEFLGNIMSMSDDETDRQFGVECLARAIALRN